jgi:citrate lyase subunit beta/citryl-CoA lyase
MPNASNFIDPIRVRNEALLAREAERLVELPVRHAVQMAHLTCPATVWKYVEGACTKSRANLVMLDLEDSIPRGNDALLAEGRANIVRAFRELDWGSRLRFFRPRGLELDPGLTDIREIASAVGERIEGLVYPKVECAEEVRSVDETLTELEKERGLPLGGIKLHVLIESAAAEERVFEIARASKRLTALVFGAFDYWSSLGMADVPYRFDHPLVDHLRARIVKAAAHVGIPAIAEMTVNYPTKDKSPAEQAAALGECRRDALYAKSFGFAGKWTGIPQQTEIVLDAFSLDASLVATAVEDVRSFQRAEDAGRGATMIRGKMADRATDRVNRVILAKALALGMIHDEIALELGLR